MADLLHSLGVVVAIGLIATGIGLRMRHRPRRSAPPPESPEWDRLADEWRSRRDGT